MTLRWWRKTRSSNTFTRWAVNLGLSACVSLLSAAPAGAALTDESSLLAALPTASTSYFDTDLDARVWQLDMDFRLSRYLSDATFRHGFLTLIIQESSRAGLSPELVLSVIEVESLFDPRAVSPAGAVGLMQIMPFWKTVFDRPGDDLLDPATNLRYGCAILAHYLKRSGGDMTQALARYNGSLGQTWYPERVMRAWDHNWWVMR
ncbi:lytic transglycosylase domain-containing protein [Larsenimonas suaedae]|uniref:Lytic transglycosylase domain-containing protein n=1 Tax=Larsenimonas suaedae TaxID=1851019 RepID=A0ABU1GVM9_9GAMM|nr:lytic transglycosylase domain-containing protein [Larsenimonas suaedae]MCM2971176.1 lytic transglycosylase domain-containing protein [Larsenimonas suaedae]MDR5895885.1 lytic transglycosylase domain-containing protein [Larsenimonas suaedae]